MDSKEYIASGILELYVAGALSEKENEEVYAMMQQYPEVKQEVLSIEAAVVNLTAATANKDTSSKFDTIKQRLGLSNTASDADETPVIPLQPKKSIFRYAGWAAAIVFATGLLYTAVLYNDLESEIEVVRAEREDLKKQIYEANSDLTAANDLLDALRIKDIITVPLGGQQVSPESYAKVYWDKKSNSIYLDLQGLPEPPPGKVYQVWSLKLNPLTPTSLGVIEDFAGDKDKVFDLQNANESEAFGITLEPAGGSESPTLEQLYTLGVVASNP
ncbi:anti-sigma-K factor rskA [Kordia periserrulae]|uniref:Anti-sigma-K factor rskA n=1 Tax=Kordia periserrulae TaxID=701523 RepID=A0A2T6C3D1_9FLAO|nr:anti-sigma factor [Kordia periserrulae]PTX62832.1 anti-sigma-K factor rskA [Kordia periserrulae]